MICELIREGELNKDFIKALNNLYSIFKYDYNEDFATYSLVIKNLKKIISNKL